MNALHNLNIASMLLEFSGVQWERVQGGWFDPETETVFTEAQVLQILAETSIQLAGAQ
jgi:hypothetical protein